MYIFNGLKVMLFIVTLYLDIIYKNPVISIYNIALDNLFSSTHKIFQNLKSKQFQNIKQFLPFQHLKINKNKNKKTHIMFS